MLGCFLVSLVGSVSEASAKIPGAKHCYKSICHRVMTLSETERSVGTRTTARTSFYDDCSVDRFNTCALTSSGEVFKPHRPDNAASPIYPDGTKLLLWNPNTKAAAVVRVNSAGPYHSNRTLDVSRATAEKLGFKRTGVATLHVQVLSAPTPAESKYKKRREYAPVPGPIGVFGTFETAAADVLQFFPKALNGLLASESGRGSARMRATLASKPMSSGLKMTRAPSSRVRAPHTGMTSVAMTRLPGGSVMEMGTVRGVSLRPRPSTMMSIGSVLDGAAARKSSQSKYVSLRRSTSPGS